MKTRRGYDQLKTPIKTNMTTKYRPQRRDYLEIFILEKHKSRMTQEKANLSRRINQIEQDIEEINKSIALIRQDFDQENTDELPKAQNRQTPKSLKKMTIAY